MSTTVSLSAGQLESIVANAYGAYLLSWAATALVLYEHVITIRAEATQIWNREFSAVTLLFILTRYTILANRMITVMGFYSLYTPQVCYAVAWIQAVITSVLVVIMSGTAAVRVYALWNRDGRLFFLVMATGIFPAITNLYFQAASTAYTIPAPIGTFICQSTPTAMTKTTYMQLSLATRIISICSDGLVVVLTWFKTYRTYSLTRDFKLSYDYSALILRDGTIYFLAVCVLNLIGIVYLMHVGTNLLNDLIVTASAILMARFLLNLRNRQSHREALSHSSLSTGATLFKGHLASDAFLDSLAINDGVDPSLDEKMSEEEEEEEEDVDDEGADHKLEWDAARHWDRSRWNRRDSASKDFPV